MGAEKLSSWMRDTKGRITDAAKRVVRDHDRLYMLARIAHNFTDKDFRKLIIGYYKGLPEATTIIVEQTEGTIDETVYCIDYRGSYYSNSGFFVLLNYQLRRIHAAERLGVKPVTVWGEKLRYYDEEMANVTENVFEYYFAPLSGIPYQKMKEYKYVIKARSPNSCFFSTDKLPDGLFTYHSACDRELEELASVYKRNIHLNQKTEAYIRENCQQIIGGKKTLGVHARGTDFKQGFKNHPIAVTPEDFIRKAEELMAAGDYEQLFLATEDQDVLESFAAVFGGRVVYYRDVARSSGDVSPHSMEQQRPLHHYKLGLEVLRDAYTLAACDALVGGRSNVSYAARIIRRSFDKEYAAEVIIDKGINEQGKVLA